MSYLLLALGVVLLYAGGEALVRGASRLARACGLSPLVIGLTVVSFGTSAPELASTLTAALRGSPDIAFGNVVGSNIANLGLILGFAALVWPLATTATFLQREVPFMLVASAAMFWLIRDGRVGRLEGSALLVALGLFLLYLLRAGSPPRDGGDEEGALELGGRAARRRRLVSDALVVATGLALLVLGARALIDGGISIARSLGISERVIGLTMVALGTSLPELAASIVAALRREGDILLGNLIGSNVFNILCILGATALVRPLPVDPSAVTVDLVVMLALSLLIWPFLATRLRLERWEGFVLLAVYALYVAFLFA